MENFYKMGFIFFDITKLKFPCFYKMFVGPSSLLTEKKNSVQLESEL